MESERTAIDLAVRRYVPKHPRRTWVKNVLIGVLIAWLVGVVAYGIPLINRATNVVHTRVMASQNTDYDHLMRMVAGLQRPDRGELGRLATIVRQLRGTGYPNEAALRGYTVFPGKFPHVSRDLGHPVTTQKDPRQDYGRFTDGFIGDVVEAVPGQLSHLIRPVYPVRSWGNLQWQYLVLASAGLWAGIGLLCLLLVVERKLWEARATRRFMAGLEYEDRQVLILVNRILQHTGRPGYITHLDQADSLWALVQRRGEDPKADPDRDIDEELRQLQAIYGDSR